MKRTAGKSLRTRRAMEQAIHLIFLLCGIVAVGFVLCISVYLVISGLPAIREIGLTKFLFGKVWAPTNATTGPSSSPLSTERRERCCWGCRWA